MEISTPSGLCGEIRKLKVKELALLSDVKLARTGRLQNEVIRSCWVRTTNPGPYSLVGTELPQFTSLLHADRDYIFKELRVATTGETLEWEVQCPTESCAHKFIAIADLTTLDTTPLPESSRNHVATGVPFTLDLAGRKVQWRLLRASDDEQIIKMVAKDVPIITAGFLARVVNVSGLDNHDPDALLAWINDLDLDDNDTLQSTMDNAEPTFSARVNIVCPRACGTEWRAMVPLVRGFLTKSTRKLKSSTESGEDQSSKAL